MSLHVDPGVQCSCVLDVNSFTISLSGRRDRSFYYYREVSQFLMALGRRCVNPKNLPPDSDLTKILDLSIADAKALNITEFLERLKFGSKFNHACKVRADRAKHDKKYEGVSVKEVVPAMKEEFARSARSYLVYLFRETQGLKGLTSDIIKGLGAFDLSTLLIDPPEFGTSCLRQLFVSFRLRGYYEITEETLCYEEYATFMDSLRQRYSGMSQPTLFIPDTVDFLMKQESLQTRPLLYKVFRLSCLCLDVPFTQLPAVKFWNINSDDPTSQLTDLIRPVQSYFANVSKSVEIMTSEESISKFLALEPTFRSTAVSDIYCPWLSVNFFDRAEVLKNLDPTGSCRKDLQSQTESQETVPMESPKSIHYDRAKKRGRYQTSSRERSSSAGSLQAGTSNS